MRKTLTLIAAAGLTCSVLTGCDQSAAQHAAARQNLDAAVQIINAANVGYLPTDAKGKYASLEDYRQHQLQQAVQALQAVRKSGAQAQQQIAARLLSQVHASAARDEMRHAMSAFTDLRARSTDLLSQLDTAYRAAAEARSYDRDPEALAGRLQQQVQQQQQQEQQLQDQIKQIQTQLSQAQSAAKDLRSQSDKLAAQAEQVRAKAFTAKGDQRYDLSNQAVKTQTAGADKSFEAEKQEVIVNDLTERLKPLQARSASLHDTIARLQGQIKDTRDAAAAVQDKLKAAQQRQSQALSALSGEFDKLADAFSKNVRQPLADASDKMNQAVDLLDKSANDPDAKLELLTRRVEQADLLSQRSMALGGFTTTVTAVAKGAKQLNAPEADHYAQVAQELTQAYRKVADAASQAIQAGQTLANQLGGNDAVKAHRQELSAFQQQLQATVPVTTATAAAPAAS